MSTVSDIESARQSGIKLSTKTSFDSKYIHARKCTHTHMNKYLRVALLSSAWDYAQLGLMSLMEPFLNIDFFVTNIKKKGRKSSKLGQEL